MMQASYSGTAGKVERSIFKAYDIRGVVDQTLNDQVVYDIGRAAGSAIRARGLTQAVVARDGRLSGPGFVAALAAGLAATGCEVIDIGRVPTPVLYFATYHLGAGSGIAVTGSHNPPDYNGFKIVIGGDTLSGDAIQQLYRRVSEQDFTTGSGAIRQQDVAAAYVERIVGDVKLARPLKVVVDAGNGVAGELAPRLMQALGCQLTTLFCDIDGHFPNHHPDPSKPQNLQDLIAAVRRERADLGLAFDGDGDRLGVVDSTGKIIWPDRQLMLYAADVCDRNPGAQIIFDIKCSRHLAPVISAHGGRPLMWKTGHSLIKAKMKESGALLAGEMSGHVFFKERWYGFDDALYTAARLLEIVARGQQDTHTLFAALPEDVSTPELNVHFAHDGEHFAFMKQFIAQAQFPGAKITTIDGIRADFADGWGLVRASNTTPSLVIRFEADDQQALVRIQQQFRAAMHQVAPQQPLPF
ncbi:MAG: phosphomannomutase/phosphoglucomutase [Gammaproteobacteria bacterium]|nr:phosphomannomutase/phosphoglucomutase [Gammaproteobacteria bacterium]